LSGKHFSIWSLVAIPLFFLCVLVLLETAGGRRRVFTPGTDSGVIEVRLVRTSEELYRYWKSLGLQGRVVVHAGRYLHYVADTELPMGYRATAAYPVVLQPLQAERDKRVNYGNFLWSAVQANMARALYMVMTPEDFKARFSSATDYPELAREGTVHDHDYGAPRVILDTIPLLRERVVLNMDASYFSAGSGEALLQSILQGRLRADVITLSLSEDNPDVQEQERSRAVKAVERVMAASPGRLKLLHDSHGGGE